MKSTSSPKKQERQAFRIDEAAEVLGVSHWTVRRLIKSGALKSCRVLRCHLIPVSEIDRLLQFDD
ncbi:MAG: helix-turn-helix domain-containing protein [Verrucomicrobiae bacterium]|nr:helix-turn-helix domain-containing protein [Verrucomicrobiae bacterium]